MGVLRTLSYPPLNVFNMATYGKTNQNHGTLEEKGALKP